MEGNLDKGYLVRWYQAMKNRNTDEVEHLKRSIETTIGQVNDPELRKFYHLLVVRYYLMGKDFGKIASALADVEPIEDDAGHWLNYFYYFFRGIY
ncbi:MAG TPA: hypothetical protein VFT51_03730, partial [Bacillales bacterium]|nr:hypothetical protein [Bacillales bacterium]